MTTEAAARQYLSEHLSEWAGRGYAVFNPNNRPLEDLPVIYGFNNGGSPGWYNAALLASDGEFLGGHVCSAEGYMPHDLGVIDGARPDRHEGFREHFPDGYRMDFIPAEQVRAGHPALDAAYAMHVAKYQDAGEPSNG